MGSFGKPTFSSKEHALRILQLVSLVVHFPLLGSSSFFLVVLSFFLVSLVITFFLSGWIEIASIMAASSHCFWSWCTNWVHWFVSDNFRSSWIKWIFCMSIVSCCAGTQFIIWQIGWTHWISLSPTNFTGWQHAMPNMILEPWHRRAA